MIDNIKYWVYKVLPLVYDDSLSYYELVNKCVTKINEIIPIVNQSKEVIEQEVQKQLQSMIDDGTLSDIINNQLLAGINNTVNALSESVESVQEKQTTDEINIANNTSDITKLQTALEADTKNLSENIANTTKNTNDITLIKSNLTDLSNKYTNVISDLLDAGIILPNNVKVKRVGSASYPTIIDATDSINTGDYTLIILPAGTHNFTALYPSTTYNTGYLMPENTFIYGEGANFTSKITASFTEMNNDYSPINCKGNFALINVAIEAYNCRYAIHDDYEYEGKCTRLFKRVAASNFNCYYHTVGGAVGTDHTVIYDGCYFRCNGSNANSALYYHNKENNPGCGYVKIKNTSFITTCLDETSTFADIGFDLAYKNSNNIVCDISGCSAHSIFTTNLANGRIDIHMDSDIPIKNAYFYDRCTAPRFERLGTRSGVTYGKGKLVTISKDMKANNTATPYSYYGVVAYVDNISVVVVKAGSFTSLAELNVSGSVSGDWEYLYLQSDVTLGLTSSAYVLGVAYHDGTARLFDYCFPKP